MASPTASIGPRPTATPFVASALHGASRQASFSRPVATVVPPPLPPPRAAQPARVDWQSGHILVRSLDDLRRWISAQLAWIYIWVDALLSGHLQKCVSLFRRFVASLADQKPKGSPEQTIDPVLCANGVLLTPTAALAHKEPYHSNNRRAYLQSLEGGGALFGIEDCVDVASLFALRVIELERAPAEGNPSVYYVERLRHAALTAQVRGAVLVQQRGSKLPSFLFRGSRWQQHDESMLWAQLCEVRHSPLGKLRMTELFYCALADATNPTIISVSGSHNLGARAIFRWLLGVDDHDKFLQKHEGVLGPLMVHGRLQCPLEQLQSRLLQKVVQAMRTEMVRRLAHDKHTDTLDAMIARNIGRGRSIYRPRY